MVQARRCGSRTRVRYVVDLWPWWTYPGVLRAKMAQRRVTSRHRQYFVQCSGNLFQLVGLARISPDLRRDRAVITYFDQGGHHGLPIHVAFQEIGEAGRFAAAAQLEILEVDAFDALAEGENPILRISVLHAVAGIEIGSHPFAVELVDEGAHFKRAQNELVPDVLRVQENFGALRVRDHLGELGSEAVPSFLGAVFQPGAVS